jgi:CheY-like chemotaxis protein
MRRILLIDDDSQVRTSMALALRANGFEVVTAESGAGGLRAFHDGPFDLAIVDVFMPGMDGVKLIKALRQRVPNFPVIAVSGVLLRASCRTALDLFPRVPDLADVVCLQKPFRPPELLEAIAKAVDSGRPMAATA